MVRGGRCLYGRAAGLALLWVGSNSRCSGCQPKEEGVQGTSSGRRQRQEPGERQNCSGLAATAGEGSVGLGRCWHGRHQGRMLHMCGYACLQMYDCVHARVHAFVHVHACMCKGRGMQMYTFVKVHDCAIAHEP